MTQEERDAMQTLVSAAIRVVRTPMTGVPIDSPMARAIFGLALQLATAGFIHSKEASRVADRISPDVLDKELGV